MAAKSCHIHYIRCSLGLGGAGSRNIDVLVFRTLLCLLLMSLVFIASFFICFICYNIIGINIDSLVLHTGEASTIGNIYRIVGLVLGIAYQGTSCTTGNIQATYGIIQHHSIRYGNIQLGCFGSAFIGSLCAINISDSSNAATADIDGIVPVAEKLGHAYIDAATRQTSLLYILIYGTIAGSGYIYLTTLYLTSVFDIYLVVMLDIRYAYSNIGTTNATSNSQHLDCALSGSLGSDIYIVGSFQDNIIHSNRYALYLASAVGRLHLSNLAASGSILGIARLGYICLGLL